VSECLCVCVCVCVGEKRTPGHPSRPTWHRKVARRGGPEARAKGRRHFAQILERHTRGTPLGSLRCFSSIHARYTNNEWCIMLSSQEQDKPVLWVLSQNY